MQDVAVHHHRTGSYRQKGTTRPSRSRGASGSQGSTRRNRVHLRPARCLFRNCLASAQPALETGARLDRSALKAFKEILVVTERTVTQALTDPTERRDVQGPLASQEARGQQGTWE